MSKMRQKSGKGSFRGVPFLIEDEQGLDGGRRLVRFEYPLRDDGLTEDLGLRLRNYHVSCLVIGDDHAKQAEKLIEALEKPEAGTLKHPYFGTKEVRVDDYKAVYSTQHLRVTRFEISFVPDVGEIAPLVKKDSLFSVYQQYADALNAMADDFAEMIDDILDFIDELTAPLMAFYDAMIGLVETVFEGIGALINVGTEFKSRFNGFKNRLVNLIHTPREFARELQALVQFAVQQSAYGSAPARTTVKTFGGVSVATSTQGAESAGNLQRILVQIATLNHSAQGLRDKLTKAQLELSRTALETLSQGKMQHQAIGVRLQRLTSQSARQGQMPIDQAKLATALVVKAQLVSLRLIQSTLALTQGNAVANAVQSALNLKNRQTNDSADFDAIESRADVQRYMAELDESLEQQALDCADHEQWAVYEALEAYRLALLTDLRSRGERLAESTQVRLTDTQPALVVAFNATGKAAGWLQLARRNQVRHPLFCLGGETVEILQ